MATYLGFQSNQCKDCFSCLRTCPVKAIKFNQGKANIVDDMCVLCGSCIHICPQNAKYIISSKDKVLKLLRDNPQEVILSVAPSFIANFEVTNFAQMNDAAKKLGFAFAEETAVGAYYVTKEYERIVETTKSRNLITTACPSVVAMIEKYYPQHVDCLIPVDSPAIAHAKYIKEHHGKQYKIVFVGPCIAKKKELEESGLVDGVLTNDEFLSIMEDKKVTFDLSISETKRDYNPARYYSISRGIVKSISKYERKWEYLGCDGASQCRRLLDGLDDIENTFIEMNMCEFGCVNGPVNTNKKGPAYATRVVRRFTKDDVGDEIVMPEFKASIERKYTELPISWKMPTEEEIKQILAKIGKYSKKDELNCKSCGYDSCRDKAVAIFNGMGEDDFCLPYMKNLAVSKSNEIIKHTPDGIVTVDKHMRILDMNRSMMSYLALNADMTGENIEDYLALPEFRECIEEKKNMSNIICYIPETQMYCTVGITVIADLNIGFAIFRDSTQELIQEEKLKSMRKDMMKITDDVINKQMRVVQEIASLLGETTAETKIALVKFRETLKENDK